MFFSFLFINRFLKLLVKYFKKGVKGCGEEDVSRIVSCMGAGVLFAGWY